MIEFVFDSSALLALILKEPGGDLEPVLDRSAISAVNLAEVRSKLIDLGQLDAESVDDDLRAMIRVEPFIEEHAIIAAQLRAATKHLGCRLAIERVWRSVFFSTRRSIRRILSGRRQ